VSNIEECDLKSWVDAAETDKETEFRQAVHTILLSISSDQELKSSMVLKGGILLAIRYQSPRFTKDIDFSTEKKLGDGITKETVQTALDKSLAMAVEELDYDLDCRVQSCQVQPRKVPNPTYPSIKLKIGFAYKGTPKHKRLEVLKSTSSISIDYSFNELTPNIESMKLGDGEEIQVYSLTDLIAEKYRSLLQQETRKRNRRQDVFDLSRLIDSLTDIEEIEKSKILHCLIEKCNSREIKAESNSFENPIVRSMAEKDYGTLENDVVGDLPEFHSSFDDVASFYKSLPWSS
jgi:predicted nucleotidyltransferase component of viral defense system